jgi:outer membrane receptor for ferrienterochelin and colicins
MEVTTVKVQKHFFVSVGMLLFLAASAVHAQTTGIISGVITDAETKDPLPFVNVVIKGTSLGGATDQSGHYIIRGVPPGVYTIAVTAVGFQTVEKQVRIDAASSIVESFSLKPASVQLGEIQVYGASLRRERITEAPAAVSLISAKEIARNAGHGQLPKLLEAEPGIDMVQSGLYDFNLNTRGFNSSLNRRVLILLDGRDLGTAFLGATEWNGLSIPLEELGRIELVRGPGSALYGANAYNGVLNITSLPPRSNPGSRVIIGAGELSMYRADVRHAAVAGPWSYRVNAGIISGKTFSKNRKGGIFEYEGFNPFLNVEVIDLNTDPVRNSYFGGRVDYELDENVAATAEGGLAEVENEVIVTGIGRVQVQKARRPWVRLSYAGHGLSANLWTNGRLNLKPELSLSTGLALTQDAWISQGEVQYAFSGLDNSLFVVLGGSHRLVSIDTKGTLMLTPRDDNMSGFFAQLEYKLLPPLKVVLAARLDRSTLHPTQFSPKAAVVYSPFAGHSFRATYNRAFQSPNYSELYLHVKHPARPLAYYGNLVTNPPGLVGFEGGAQPGTPKDLTVEKITGFEIGYKGVFANQLFVTLDAYYNQLTDFVTDLAVGVNPKYPSRGIYEGETALRTIWSYVNAGKVNEGGFELALNYYFSDEWRLSYNYSQFAFEVLEKHLNDVLLPNAPDYRMGGGVTYTHPEGHDAEVTVKYTPGFKWAAGIYQGTIKPYTLVNASGTYRFSNNLSFNLNISNLLNKKHYQIFGGSLIGRRAVVIASYTL